MRTSHQKCERCHIRQAHKRAKYNMCPPCRREYRRELELQRTAINRTRRVDPVHEAIVDVELERKGLDQVVAEFHALNVRFAVEDNPVPKVAIRKIEPTTNGRVSQMARMSDEAKLEIGKMYEDGLSYATIRTRARVSNATIAQVARDLALPARGKGPRPRAQVEPEDFIDTSLDAEPGQAVFDLVPEPVVKAIERMVLPPKPEPVLHSTRVPAETQHWHVKVEGILDVYSPSIEEALALVRKTQPELKITGIQLGNS